MRKIPILLLLLACLLNTAATGPELPIQLIYRRWVVVAIDPTQMPAWQTMSEEGRQANLRLCQKMIEKKCYYEFNKDNKATILVYNPFHKAETCPVPTAYTYSKSEQSITLESAEKTDENGDMYRVPEMAYRVDKLTQNELVLTVVKNNFKITFKRQ